MELAVGSLTNTIALVTGASRGLGKGIALALGEAGATVYVTGRSSSRSSSSANGTCASSTENLPGTIEETAAAVTALGGHGIAVRCDHTIDADVAALFDQVKQEQGRLDLLVNNAWGGYEAFDWSRFTAPFWEQPSDQWQKMFDAGVRAQLVASQFAVPLMLAGEQNSGRPRGLIIHTVAWDRDKYLSNLFYDLAKNATVRMTFGMVRELAPHQIAVVALAPGFVATERIAAAFTAAGRSSEGIETPAYIGRAVVALTADPHLLTKSGKVLTVGDLAREYNFTDATGIQHPPLRTER
jgi:NAD(P)-dependent dehydrogenase (short-subunit alcohol dehydrogenase family)